MPAPTFEIAPSATETKVAVRGSLDINSAPGLAEAVDALLAAKPPKVVVDLSGLDLIDSSGVAALVKLYKGTKSGGAAFQMIGVRDQPLAIFKLLRMDKVFGI